MGPQTTSLTYRNNFVDACTEDIPRPSKRSREAIAVVGAESETAQKTVARAQTQAPTRMSAPCVTQEVPEVAHEAEFVTAANPQTHPATRKTETYVTPAFSEAERDAAAERQGYEERVRKVRYPTPRLPLQIPRSTPSISAREARSLSPDSPQELLSVSPSEA